MNNSARSHSNEHLTNLKKDSRLIIDGLNMVLDNQSRIMERISGSNIGKVQEYLTLSELKSSFPIDSFSDEFADKHGTDIVATVCESGLRLGIISISVKHQKKWNPEFISQFVRNLSQDNTRWGFIVTTTFPSEALNQNIWTACDESGRIILLVKPEFASIAYYAVRTIVLYELQLRKIVRLYLEKNYSNAEILESGILNDYEKGVIKFG
jgi:hypothetical protein